MDKTTKIVIGVIIAVIVVVGIWYGVTRKPAEKEPIKIGGLFGLTGFSNVWGIHEKNAAQLAIDDINEKGGIDGHRIQFIVEDTQSDPTYTVTAAMKLISVDNVSVIIGPTWAQFFEVVAPVAEKNKVVLLGASGVSATGEDLGVYSFSMRPPAGFDGEPVAELAQRKGAKNVAVVFEQNAYAIAVSNHFKDKAKELGLEIKYAFGKNPADTDYRTDLIKIKNANVDFVYVVFADSNQYPVIMKQAKELGLKSIFAVDPAVSGINIQEHQKVLEGVYFADYKPAEEFVERYKTEFQLDPSPSAAWAYDAVQIVAKIIKEQKEATSEAIRGGLNELHNYQGVSGIVSFDNKGYRTRLDFVVKVIRDGQIVPYYGE